MEFWTKKDSFKVFHSFSARPHSPGMMCSLGSNLLYINQTSYSREIRHLDCSKMPPVKTSVVTRAIKTPFYDLCCVQGRNDNLVVATHGRNGVSAYRLGTDHMEWKVTSKLPDSKTNMDAHGITAFQNDHLLVCDYANECIQMISRSGRYLGEVFRAQNRGRPDLIRCCVSTSSLAVTYESDGTWSIHIIKPFMDGKLLPS